MANEIILTGWKEFQGKLNKLPKEVIEQADAIVEDHALDWEERAKVSAPVDKGFLRQGIRANKVSDMNWQVLSNVNYSPYREWGTGTKVRVPSELQRYAIQFKGKRSVIGSRPTPYFFIHKQPIEQSLINSLRQLVETPK
jgi:hypothetical protein